ncbi:MAG: ABC transporter substrate-binding protein [Acidimicrobiia bacterium]|nr:ABC transporter substrate-binding protein [Acidimicrobiia bacterium]
MTAVRTRVVASLIGAVLVVGACSDDAADSDGASTDADTAALSFDERCAANEAAGTITFVSSFDFAAAATILDVIVADAEGYFEDYCLDVDIKPGFAPGNGGLVAEGQAQISSAGSFGELVNTNVQGDAGLVAIAQYGKTAIETLVVPADGSVTTLDDLAGTTVGVKGDLPYSLQAMLGIVGVERSSFDELLLDGFDPVAHLDLGIDALPVYKSNEPAQLDAAGVAYREFDPLDFDVPASFGVFFTSSDFLADHPTAVEDFLRAAFLGFAFAVDDPETAVGYAFDRIDAAGNPNFFSNEGEGFRWVTESALVLDTTASGEGPGLLDSELLGAEIELLTEVGVFDEVPDWRSMVADGVADRLYDGTDVVELRG